MATFSIPDLSSAVAGYPALSVDMKIVDLNVVSGTSGSVNVNEIWGFKVQVTNNGDLNMSKVSVHIVAVTHTDGNDAQVSLTSNGGWTGDIHPPYVAVNAGESVKTAECYFKAPAKKTTGNRDLIQVHIADWDADLSYILTAKAGHSDPPNYTYGAQIYP